MLNNQKLVKKLTKQKKQLENHINHRKLYNIRNTIIKALIKSGIAIDYALPFILSSVIVASVQASNGDLPFKADEITNKEKASVETIDTSNGIHVEYTSYDFDYKDEVLQYSTGWIINNKGLYERTVTSYKLNNTIDLSDTEKVFSMTKEEIENSLEITNIKTIQKNILQAEDEIYNEDALIIINHYTQNEEKAVTRTETALENFANSIVFLSLSFCLGLGFLVAKKIFIKTCISDGLKKCESKYRIVTKEELNKLKEILELKEKNLELLTSNKNNDYPYKLRRG